MRRVLSRFVNRIFRREVDLDELPFREYLEVLESNGDEESLQLSKELRELPKRIALFERNATGTTLMLSEIEVMSWKEIKFRVSLMKEDVVRQLESIEKIIEGLEQTKVEKIGRGWDGAIVAT